MRITPLKISNLRESRNHGEKQVLLWTPAETDRGSEQPTGGKTRGAETESWANKEPQAKGSRMEKKKNGIYLRSRGGLKSANHADTEGW